MPDFRERDEQYAREAVERFVRRYEPSYRALVYYAALPLVLTPELINYLRNHFLRGTGVPWIAEVDVLLSELCRPVGYESYAMDTAVRAYAIAQMRQTEGVERIQAVAELLIRYVRQLARTNAYFSRHERQAQEWAAMVYIDDGHVAQEMARAFQRGMTPPDQTNGATLADRAEMLRLARLVEMLKPELQQYPALVEYAQDVAHLLTDPATLRPEQLRKTRTVAGIDLTLTPLLPKDQPVEQTELIAGVPFEFVWIPSGRFQMGQTKADKEYLLRTEGKEGYERYWMNELPRHEVVIEQGFWIGKYPVTQAQWLAVMGENPAYFNKKKVGKAWQTHPVESVSWDDVQTFLEKLNAHVKNTPLPPSRGEFDGRQNIPLPPSKGEFDGGRNTPLPPSRGEFAENSPFEGGRGMFPDEGKWVYRLPSEAEWEYACRAGTETIFFFGNDVEELEKYAWYDKNSKRQTHPVGQLLPNSWGVYDLLGNVWEWCADPWHKNYEGAPSDGSIWGNLGDNKAKRLLRGGSWNSEPVNVRCAYCDRFDSAYQGSLIGFRVVRVR